MDVVYFLRVVWFLASFLSYALPALVFVIYFFLFSLIFKLVKLLAGLPQSIPQKVWSFRARRNSFPERFDISALGETHFPKGLAFPHMAKVVSRMVWHFRARRKSFPERFSISALGESHFPKGLAFPRSAKVISRKVWSFRVWRKSFHESLDNLTPKDVYLGQGEKIKKIREIIKQNSINKRIFDNKTRKYQSKKLHLQLCTFV